MRYALVLLLAACGHPGSHGGSPDADTGDAASDAATGASDAAIDAPLPCDDGLTRCGQACVDTTSSSTDCGSCGHACDTGSTCTQSTCKPGAPATANGTCTYVDQPGWLSCPTGMSCQCYYHYDRLFQNQPAHLDTWRSDATLEITGGMIPSNQTMYGVTTGTITLVSDGQGGFTGNSLYPYQVTITPAGATTIRIYATSGYVPPAYVLYGDADCGNEGKILDCTFTD